MKMSIVIPTYNSEKYLDKALTSIVLQSHENYEVIVIDGGSRDATIDILKKYERVFLNRLMWTSEPDKGEPDAINKGLKKVTGDIVAYLDSDDTYEPDSFKKVMQYFKKNPNIMWVFGKCRVINEKGYETRKTVTRFKEMFQPFYSYSTLLMFDYIAQPSAFWRKEVLDSVGYMAVNEKLAFDYDYWLRIGARYKAGFINEYLACWRSHQTSETAKALRQDLREGLNLSVKYSQNQVWLRPFQYGIYGLAYMGYKRMGAL
jgi:glycosyltransferase involved in cell wall biosynthesis